MVLGAQCSQPVLIRAPWSMQLLETRPGRAGSTSHSGATIGCLEPRGCPDFRRSCSLVKRTKAHPGPCKMQDELEVNGVPALERRTNPGGPKQAQHRGRPLSPAEEAHPSPKATSSILPEFLLISRCIPLGQCMEEVSQCTGRPQFFTP